MLRFPLIVILSIAWIEAKADDFADIDAKRLAQGVEILAAKWTIPNVVFLGATDDFAKSESANEASVPSRKPLFPETYEDLELAGRCNFDDGFSDSLMYGVLPTCIPGAVSRRRD